MIKGKGMMRTHFLEGNDSATMEEIMGTYTGNEDDSRNSTPEKTDKTKTPPDTPPGNSIIRPSTYTSDLLKYVSWVWEVTSFDSVTLIYF